MKKIRNFSFLISCFIYSSCGPKEIFFSYKIERYSIDSLKRPISSSDLISYGDYLLEFRKRMNVINIQHGNKITEQQVNYDTISVYLLSEKSKMYYEFDTFSFDSKIKEKGKLADKKHGVGFSDSISVSAGDEIFSSPAETTLNNITCFITKITKPGNKDSIEQKMLLIKSKKFNSVYNINGIKFTDNNYCIVGFYVYDAKKKEGFSEEINAMRPLTKKEKKICEMMVEKIGGMEKVKQH